MRKAATILILLGLFAGIGALPAIAGDGQTSNTIGDAEDDYLPVLPRWREGGTPYNPQQSLYPYAISSLRTKDMPTGYIASPPEYDPCRGVLFYYVSSQWPTVVRDLVVALTADPLHDEIAYVVVPSASQQTSATNVFTAGGADMSKVRFFIEPGNALWLRDYGPHFAWQNGNLMIVDSHYYPSRPLELSTPLFVPIISYRAFLPV